VEVGTVGGRQPFEPDEPAAVRQLDDPRGAGGAVLRVLELAARQLHRLGRCGLLGRSCYVRRVGHRRRGRRQGLVHPGAGEQPPGLEEGRDDDDHDHRDDHDSNPPAHSPITTR